MGQLAIEVKSIVEDHFTGAQTDVEETPDGRIVGSVIWEGFGTADQVARQEEVRSHLKNVLGARMVNVGVLLLYTPRELAVMQEA